MALVIYVLLEHRIDYPSVLGVLLVSAIAGVVSHIPAGLGVLEGVFIGLLGTRLPESTLLAALIGYRALYFLGPLLVATLILATFEAKPVFRRRAAGG
jgi:glycosyltransferase 2 family protein